MSKIATSEALAILSESKVIASWLPIVPQPTSPTFFFGIYDERRKLEGFLPSATAALWFFLPREPLLFKPLDKIVLVAKSSDRARARFALDFWRLARSEERRVGKECRSR